MAYFVWIQQTTNTLGLRGEYKLQNKPIVRVMATPNGYSISIAIID